MCRGRFGLGWLFAMRGPRPPPPTTVVVSLDRESAERLGLPEKISDWPRASVTSTQVCAVARNCSTPDAAATATASGSGAGAAAAGSTVGSVATPGADAAGSNADAALAATGAASVAAGVGAATVSTLSAGRGRVVAEFEKLSQLAGAA